MPQKRAAGDDAGRKRQSTREGMEVPIPTRGDFFADLKKAATPEKSRKRRAAKKR